MDASDYAAEGNWTDANRVRFRLGLPESIGGWQPYTRNTYMGSCRTMHQWNGLQGDRFLAAGTNLKLYIEASGTFYDITPIRLSLTLATNPFDPTTGNSIVTITHTAHNASAGDYVTYSGATGAIPMNGEFQILAIVDANSYTVDAGVIAGSGTVFGGSAVVADYQVTTGIDVQALGTGFGTGPYGRGTWGSSVIATLGESSLRIWSLANFGEDLICCPNYSPIYVWDATNGVGNRAIAISGMAGANQVPVVVRSLSVTDDRHVVAFGCNDVFDTVYDAMLVRWCARENYLDWEPRTDNTSGSYRLSVGSEIVCHCEAKGETVIWTNKAIYSQQFVGAPFTFGFTLITSGVSIISPHAAINARNSLYWMDENAFYQYNGSVIPVACPVLAHIFDDLNHSQRYKIHCGLNSQFNEIWWFYPSADSPECDRYVAFNFLTQEWTVGRLARTAWLDLALDGKPIAAEGGKLFQHEVGLDDEAAPLNSYISSADFDLGDGQDLMFMKRFIPDITLRKSAEAGDTGVLWTLWSRDFPGSPKVSRASKTVFSSTDQCHIRMRGRQSILRIECDALGTGWRLGAPRLDMQPDGGR
jgi:hypothetical protein